MKITSASQFARVMRMAGLVELASQIRADRHAAGMPTERRREAAKISRSDLRNSIRNLCLARDALANNDIERFEFLRDRARLFFAHATTKMRSVVLDDYSTKQAARRTGKGVDKDEVKRYHARLIESQGPHSTTSKTATYFGLSTRQIRQILRS